MINLYPIIKNLIKVKYFTFNKALNTVLVAYDEGAVTKQQAQELILLIEEVYNVKLVNKKDEENR